MTSQVRAGGRRPLTVAAALALATGVVAGCSPAATPPAPSTATVGSTTQPGTPVATPSPTAAPRAPAVPVTDASRPLPATPVVPPVRLEVPTVGVDMPVDPEGVADDGSMALPPDANRAGWYRYGPGPLSAAGTTLVAAHVDSRLSGVGPFARLRRVGVGDPVTVTASGGTRLAYTVVDVTRVPKDTAPVGAWFDRDGAPRLVLVTCGGAWLADIGHYADNVVVTAEPTRG
ncbi:class F sortase [Cellulomonas sp.]|uniref:class F sortase n=1 Tax=Cellulomonas sp. TaxID=40001 RepID=UPI0025C255FD|nr:class F sortase [Cellulomonas sp.]